MSQSINGLKAVATDSKQRVGVNLPGTVPPDDPDYRLRRRFFKKGLPDPLKIPLQQPNNSPTLEAPPKILTDLVFLDQVPIGRAALEELANWYKNQATLPRR